VDRPTCRLCDCDSTDDAKEDSLIDLRRCLLAHMDAEEEAEAMRLMSIRVTDDVAGWAIPYEEGRSW